MAGRRWPTINSIFLSRAMDLPNKPCPLEKRLRLVSLWAEQSIARLNNHLRHPPTGRPLVGTSRDDSRQVEESHNFCKSGFP